MPILLDGNNLLHRLPDAQGRGDVRRQVLAACRAQRRRVTVVFDGPPPSGAPARELLGPVTIHYAGPASADEVMLARIPAGPRGREWVVVTDDRDLARRARELGATTRGLAEWLRQAPSPAPRRGAKPARAPTPDEVSEWEAYFAQGRDGDED